MTPTLAAAGLPLCNWLPDPSEVLDSLSSVSHGAGGRLSPAVVIALAVVCAALTIAIAVWSRLQYRGLPELSEPVEKTAEDHVVIIPVRNEQRDISRAVASFPDSLVCVVDDGSTDRTAELAAAAGAHVFPAPEPAPGWTGKNNACWTGAQGTESKWILFTDARTEYSPRFLPALLEYARAHSLQAVSVYAPLTGGALMSRVLWPCASALYCAALNAARISTAQSRQSLQADRCLLFLRSGYDFIGGHRRVSGSVTVDLALAGLLQAHRMNCLTLRCESMAAAHGHHRFAELWSALQRFGCRFLGVTPAVRLRLFLAGVIQLAWLPILLLLLARGSWLGAAVFYLAIALSWLPWHGVSPLVLVAPWAVYPVLGCASLGALRHFLGFSIPWKGRRT